MDEQVVEGATAGQREATHAIELPGPELLADRFAIAEPACPVVVVEAVRSVQVGELAGGGVDLVGGDESADDGEASFLPLADRTRQLVDHGPAPRAARRATVAARDESFPAPWRAHRADRRPRSIVRGHSARLERVHPIGRTALRRAG
jgi:hypothetical protein